MCVCVCPYYEPYFTTYFLDIKISKNVHKNMHPEGLPEQFITITKYHILLSHSEKQSFRKHFVSVTW
jgi:hypothetical protein